jgi:hypothetical protein
MDWQAIVMGPVEEELDLVLSTKILPITIL